MTQSNGRSPRKYGPTERNINLNIPINLQPNSNVKVNGAGIDTFVPVIPEVRTEDIKELFRVKYLTKLDGEPTHDWLETVEKELGRNFLAVKCSFGDGTSITDKARQKPVMVGLTLLIILRLALIAGIDHPDMTVFFWNNSAASGRRNGRSGQFCVKIFTDKAGQL